MDHTQDHLDLGETAVLDLPCACARTHTNREIARNAKLRDKMFEHSEHSGVRKKVILKEDKRVYVQVNEEYPISMAYAYGSSREEVRV